MKRLLIIPIMLWAGLCAHAQQLLSTSAADSLAASERLSTDMSDPLLKTDASEKRSSFNYRKTHRNHGIIQGYHDNGELEFYGSVKKNRLQGIWKSWYEDGTICDSGKFVKDVPDGEWKAWYPNGRLKYVWNFSASKYYSLKAEMLSQPKYSYFRISQLPLNEGVKYFKTDYMFSQTKRSPAIMLRGKALHLKNFDAGDVKKRVDRNTESETYLPPFPECLFHGNFISYYPDGRIKEEGVYINGMRDGLWEEQTTNGKKSRGSYHHGKKSGEWRTYSSQGKLLSYKRYNNSGTVSDAYEFGAGE